jgi:hypothetical protein
MDAAQERFLNIRSKLNTTQLFQVHVLALSLQTNYNNKSKRYWKAKLEVL